MNKYGAPERNVCPDVCREGVPRRSKASLKCAHVLHLFSCGRTDAHTVQVSGPADEESTEPTPTLQIVTHPNITLYLSTFVNIINLRSAQTARTAQTAQVLPNYCLGLLPKGHMELGLTSVTSNVSKAPLNIFEYLWISLNHVTSCRISWFWLDSWGRSLLAIAVNHYSNFAYTAFGVVT